jgi:hypothetical protein
MLNPPQRRAFVHDYLRMAKFSLVFVSVLDEAGHKVNIVYLRARAEQNPDQ